MRLLFIHGNVNVSQRITVELYSHKTFSPWTICNRQYILWPCLNNVITLVKTVTIATTEYNSDTSFTYVHLVKQNLMYINNQTQPIKFQFACFSKHAYSGYKNCVQALYPSWTHLTVVYNQTTNQIQSLLFESHKHKQNIHKLCTSISWQSYLIEKINKTLDCPS